MRQKLRRRPNRNKEAIIKQTKNQGRDKNQEENKNQ